MFYKNIALPVDGSDLSLTAIDEVLKIANREESKILLIGIVEELKVQFEGYDEFVSVNLDLKQKMKEQMEALLKKEAEKLRSRGYHSDIMVGEGAPHEEISRICKEWDADIIVMTTHGRRGFSHWLLGSVTEKLMRMAPCPILVVRPKLK